MLLLRQFLQKVNHLELNSSLKPSSATYWLNDLGTRASRLSFHVCKLENKIRTGFLAQQRGEQPRVTRPRAHLLSQAHQNHNCLQNNHF